MAPAPASWIWRAIWMSSASGEAPTASGETSFKPRYGVERSMGYGGLVIWPKPARAAARILAIATRRLSRRCPQALRPRTVPDRVAEGAGAYRHRPLFR